MTSSCPDSFYQLKRNITVKRERDIIIYDLSDKPNQWSSELLILKTIAASIAPPKQPIR